MAKTSPFSVRTASMVLLIAMMALTLAPAAPVSAQPAGSPASRAALLPTALSFVNVAAPAINKVFDLDGVIIVNDIASHFLPTGATGDAFLQTRLWPAGQVGRAVGKYPYLYRIDLRNAVLAQGANSACISTFEIPFGPIVKLDYDGDGQLDDDGFVITQGGMGNIAPLSVTTDGTTVQVAFDPAVCAGRKQGSGDSTFFFGMASNTPPQPVKAKVYQGATATSLDSRAPIIGYDMVNKPCITTLASASDIPSPALINFDSVGDKWGIAETYHGNYGLAFGTNVFTSATSAKPGPRSAPNIAVGNLTAAALAFTYDSEVSHVGFYAVNTLTTAATGMAVAFDSNNTAICRKSVSLPAQTNSNFVGFYDPAQRIHRVEYSVIDANQKPTPAQIDDLNFSPSNVTPLEFPHPKDPLGAGGPEVVTHGMDDTQLGVTINLPEPSLWREPAIGFPNLVRFGLPGVELNGSLDGYPDVPVVRRLIAYPEGTKPVVSATSVMVQSAISTEVYPSQPPALDAAPQPDPNAWKNPPFTLNTKIYSTYGFFPTAPASVFAMTDTLGKMRDLNLALLTVAAGRYNPLTKELLIYKSVDVDIKFEGTPTGFLPPQALNVFEPDVDKYYGQVLNSSILSKYLTPGLAKAICGTEFYIVTPPSLLSAAQTLATWKTSKGISTQVVQYAAAPTGIGNTKEQVKAFLQNKYNTCLFRPSYLLLLGDAELIGTWPYSGTNSDLGYATMDGATDILPDLAYGRIPVDTLAQANTVVNKIIAYEKTPPATTSFYKTFTFSAYFECCSSTSGGLGNDDRSFVETAEIARSALVAAGKTVNRIYTAEMPAGVTPARYRNGAPLPASIGPGSGFAWNGSTANVISAYNTGSGLMLHRDHGWPYGWWRPYFDTTNLSSLTNGALTPVVYSVNCASGLWDNELPGSGQNASDVLWSEAILRMNGGAVSVIGDMRNSPTWANSALARGLFDATWPNTDTTYGDGSVHRRLGDILNYAKLYMLAQVYIPQSAGAVTMDQFVTDNELYHVIGDPTLELWTGYPYVLVLPKTAVITPITLPAPGFETAAAGQGMQVDYPVEGATITLLQNGLPVGRGVVSGGKAIIPLQTTVDPKIPLNASASMDDSIGVLLNQPEPQNQPKVYMPVLSK